MSARVHIDVAAGILVDREQRILIGERPASAKHSPNFWEFPGGKLEPGEDAVTALVRELEEELGVAAITAEWLTTRHHSYAERDVTVHFFKVLAWQGRPQSIEGQRLEWVSLKTLPTYRLLPADVPLAEQLGELLALPTKRQLTDE
ncbi:MAG: (deoxy)nucleoside triphosphate pyrophosphohydrolase [Pseudomonadota bacterium]